MSGRFRNAALCAALSLAVFAPNAAAKPPALVLDATPLIGVTSTDDSSWRSLHVRLENPEAHALRGVVEVESHPPWTRSAVELVTSVPFSLGPRARVSVEIPTRGFGGGSPAIRVLARSEQGELLGETRVTAARSAEATVLDLGTPSRIAPALRGLTFASRRGIPFVGRSRAASSIVASATQDTTTGDLVLPELPAGYGATTLVVGTGRDLTRLSDAELSALADWVLAGGALALGLDRPEDLNHPLIVALAGGQAHEGPAPLELRNPTTFVVPPEDPEQLAPSPGGVTPFRTQRLAPSSLVAKQLVGYAGGNLQPTPFGASASYGLGELHLLAFSPRDAQVLGDAWVRYKLTDLLRHAYDREPQATVRRGALSPGEVNVDGVRRELDPNQTSRWTIVASALVLLIYAGLAGPLSFYLAAKKGRPLRALWQLPIWSAATLLVIVTLGVVSKGLYGQGRRLALFDAGAGMTRAAALRFRGFYAPSSRDLTVRATRRDHVLDVAGTALDMRRKIVIDGEGPRLQGLRTKPWQTVLVREEGFAELGGGVSVVPQGDDYVIKNRAARDLLGVVVRLPSGVASYFARIKDGHGVRASEGVALGSLGTPAPVGTAGIPLDAGRFAPTLDKDHPGLGKAWLALEPALGGETDWWPTDVPVVLFALDGGEGRLTDSGVKVDYDRVLVRVVGQGGTP